MCTERQSARCAACACFIGMATIAILAQFAKVCGLYVAFRDMAFLATFVAGFVRTITFAWSPKHFMHTL